MKIKQALIDFFFGAILEDREIAEERGEKVPIIELWQWVVVVFALIVGIALGIRTLFLG